MRVAFSSLYITDRSLGEREREKEPQAALHFFVSLCARRHGQATGQMSEEEYREGPRRLNKEEEERLIARLFTESVEQRQLKLEELDRRYYPVAEPQRISQEQLQKSVERQVDQEMAIRQARREEAEAATFKRNNRASAAADEKRASRADGSGATMSSEEVEASVKRMYDETLARKQVNLEESKRRYAPPAPKTKKVSKNELQEWVAAASKPKKTEFTIDEVNKIYGLTAESANT